MSDLPVIGVVCAMYGPPWNEGEKNIARALELGLPAHGFAARVYHNTMHDNGAPVRHRPSPWKIATSVRFWRSAGLAARRDGARVMHVVTSLSSILGVKCAVIKSAARTPLVLHVTGLSQPLRGHRLFLSAERVIVGGEYLRPWFPDAIDLPPVSPHVRAQGAPPSPPASGKRLLWLGSMEPVRGVHDLADALGLLRQRGDLNGTRLTLAWNGLGHAEYAESIRRRCADHGIETIVRWEGVTPELGRLYEEHDVVVIPRATDERMGWPLRLLEAFSHGRPVVTSDVGDMPSVGAGCGLFYRRGDVAGLADALHAMASDPALYARLQQETVARAARYSPASTIARIAGLYGELLDCRR